MKCNLTLCSCGMGAMPQCPDFDGKVNSMDKVNELRLKEQTTPTQEPVGWAWLNTNMAEVLFRGNCMEGLTPLYTHPPLRELSDEEIGECMGLDLAMQGTAYMEIVNKVRACFKKAREK